MTSSLRTRLLMGTVGGMVLLLVCFSFIVYTVIRQALLSEFDRALASTAEILAAFIEVEADEVKIDGELKEAAEFSDTERSALYQIWKPNGEVAAKSSLLGAYNLPRFHGPADAPAYQVFRDPRTYRPDRAIAIQFSPKREGENPRDASTASAEQTIVMVVARDAGELYHRLSFLRWLLFGTTGGTAGLAFLVGAVVVRRGLRPLQSIAAEIAAIDEKSLEAPLQDASTPAEIRPIQERLNNLLSRLKEAFERERRFSANVAHELRNPLAGMRSTIEVTLARRREGPEYRQALCECLGIIDGMQAMVGNLLLLARMDADQMVFHMERAALSEMVDSCWEAFSSKAVERGLTFDNRIPGDLVLMCDRPSLGVVFSNLLGNAVEYTDPGGRVWMQAQKVDGVIEIVAANTGCRLSPDQTTRVFDRFWRADPSRSDAGTHCGLGLSLVWRIAQAFGGSVSATVEEGSFVLRLRLPGRQ